ncbi:MAG: hypothetical protein ABFR82_14360 [Nitrospirota bacterium]
MKKLLSCFSMLIIAGMLMSSFSYAAGDVYYSRCNLKVIKGGQISWVNWQATKDIVPVGTKLEVTHNGSSATAVDVATGKSYIIDVGSDGDVFLQKFLSKEKVEIDQFPSSVQQEINKAFAKVGMTKEQTYIAMGPPAWAGNKTHVMTYNEIIKEDLWTYKRRRFSKNIGVSFGDDGRVDRTEGIWGK